MRKLTISPRMQRFEFDLLIEKLGETLPDLLFSLLSTYGGMYLEERNLSDLEGKTWKLGEIKSFSFIYDYIDDIREEVEIAGLNIKLVPFANDEAGWVFCVSTEDKYPVYIFKSTDYADKEAFAKIANSLEEFINSLKSTM